MNNTLSIRLMVMLNIYATHSTMSPENKYFVDLLFEHKIFL
jgi:hypothetical protein